METQPIAEAKPAEEPMDESLDGVNVLLMGPGGTGKTHSIGTLVETGIEVFYLSLEAGKESLMGYWKDRKKPIPTNLHWHTLQAPATSFLDMLDSARNINTLGLDTLAKMQDPNRSHHNQFISLLECLSNFPDDRTGKKFGAVNTWGPDMALVMDGLTGLNSAAMSLVIGGKPVRNQSDWQIAQDQIYKIIVKLTDHCPCHFILISHVVRETDQILGGVKLMVSTLGKALAPMIPPKFSDVILTTREGSQWYWDTASSIADVKTRNLPIQAKNLPNFKTIIDKWRQRGGGS